MKINKNIQVLIVEDEKDIRDEIVRTLSKLYSVHEAEDGLVAKTIIEANIIDVVITDIDMPNCCGNDLIDFLIQREQPFIPVVITSAHDKISEKYRELPCIRVENKPYSIKKVIARVEELYLIQKSKCKLRDAFMKIGKATKTAKDILTLIRKGNK